MTSPTPTRRSLRHEAAPQVAARREPAAAAPGDRSWRLLRQRRGAVVGGVEIPPRSTHGAAGDLATAIPGGRRVPHEDHEDQVACSVRRRLPPGGDHPTRDDRAGSEPQRLVLLGSGSGWTRHPATIRSRPTTVPGSWRMVPIAEKGIPAAATYMHRRLPAARHDCDCRPGRAGAGTWRPAGTDDHHRKET